MFLADDPALRRRIAAQALLAAFIIIAVFCALGAVIGVQMLIVGLHGAFPVLAGG